MSPHTDLHEVCGEAKLVDSFKKSAMSLLKTNWPKTYLERSKFMFKNEVLSDVKFVVQASQNGESSSKTSKLVIPAHKFLLSVCSPVFFAMFCGEMAETKEEIDLPDCEYESMLELLRYIYTDEVCLNGDNVMQVLYLAEKYNIPNLTSVCAEYLRKHLDVSNVLCVLKHSQQYEIKDLLLDCWDLVDFKTEEALKSAEFMTMERCFLEELLDRDTLNITEVQLFQAVDCWAAKECERQKVKADGSKKRQIVGEQIVTKIRFPVMKQSEFQDIVLGSKILTEEEASNITKYFDSTLTGPVGFTETQRVGSPLRCCRFESFLYDRDWENDPERLESTELIVDKDIRLYGVSLFGDDGSEYTVTLKIFRNARKRSFLASTTGTFTSGAKESTYGTYHGFDVYFDSPVFLKKNVDYYIEASIDGPESWVFKHEACNVAPCEGVVFYIDGTWRQFAEFLFVKR